MTSMAEPTRDSQIFPRGRGARREPVVPNGVLGMVVFIITEVMFFAGLVSAYIVAKGAATGGWPPPGQPRLPVEQTAVNTLFLLASAPVLFFARRALADDPRRARKLLLVAMVLGAVFVGLQGAEWIMLIGQGLTLQTSTHGSFFYTIIGVHGLHAVAAIAGLVWAHAKLRRGELERSALVTVSIFWYFVVLIWPILYYQVYLS